MTACTSCHFSEGATIGVGGACMDCHAAPAQPAHAADWTECHDCHDPMPGWPAKKGWRQAIP